MIVNHLGWFFHCVANLLLLGRAACNKLLPLGLIDKRFKLVEAFSQ